MESAKKRQRDVLPKLETLMEDLEFHQGRSRTTNRTSERCESKKNVTRISARRTNDPELDVEEAELKYIGAKLRYLLSDYPSLVRRVYRDETGQIVVRTADILSRGTIVGIRLAAYEGTCYQDRSEDSTDRIARFVRDTYVELTWFDSDYTRFQGYYPFSQ